jgi:sugar lactone lactonase YvrE
MYFVDSWKQTLDAFEYDLASGELGARRTIASIDASAGMPDGINVDSEGCIYVALYGGSCLHRYEPNGRLDSIVQLPVRFPTSCEFGGDDLRTIYVTTSAVGLRGTGPQQFTVSSAETSDLDGAVLVGHVSVPGLSSRRCAATIAEIAHSDS